MKLTTHHNLQAMFIEATSGELEKIKNAAETALANPDRQGSCEITQNGGINKESWLIMFIRKEGE